MGMLALSTTSVPLWDTAGLSLPKDTPLSQDLAKQTLFALQQTSLVLFVLDAREGILPADYSVAEWLRTHLEPHQSGYLVANKAEHLSQDIMTSLAGEALRLGFGEPLFVSAEHNIGMSSLHGLFQTYFCGSSPLPASPAAETPIRIAFIGRPNVGKSTLVNAILKEQRLLAGATPGLTRDAIVVSWRYKEQAFELVDTAGQRRQARVQDPLERLATSKTRHITRTADIVCLVLDATVPIEKQDFTLGRRAIDGGLPLIVVLNKCDKITDIKSISRAAQEAVTQGLSQEKGIPIVTISAQEGTNIQEIFSWSFKLHRRTQTILGTAVLNRWLQEATKKYAPPSHRGKHPHIKYITQTGRRPLSFLVFGTRTEAITTAYRRYLLNGFVKKFHLSGIPIRLTFRQTENPYGKLTSKGSPLL
jgi:GTP-binding protein